MTYHAPTNHAEAVIFVRLERARGNAMQVRKQVRSWGIKNGIRTHVWGNLLLGRKRYVCKTFCPKHERITVGRGGSEAMLTRTRNSEIPHREFIELYNMGKGAKVYLWWGSGSCSGLLRRRSAPN